MDTISLDKKISSDVDTVFPGIQFRYGYRYSRNSVPVWMSIFQFQREYLFQEISSNMNTDIPGDFSDLCKLDFYWVSKDGGK
ncbi:hypothetical protein RIR_jg33012.t1 [Rhizophagus irregularis DAOM 181602=DAOM 197198]|nr:hypothetical protein RIR_jg33012.t1 [Rhizophagus irregularis DAOM 181602=DAOM 197198]